MLTITGWLYKFFQGILSTSLPANLLNSQCMSIQFSWKLMLYIPK